MVHGMREQGKEGSSERSDKGVDCNRTVRVEPVTIDQIAHTLPERNHTAEAKEGNRENLWYPGDVWVASPGKPEETSR